MQRRLNFIFSVIQLQLMDDTELRAEAEAQATSAAPKTAIGFALSPIKTSTSDQEESLAGFTATYYTHTTDEQGLAECNLKCHRLKQKAGETGKSAKKAR
jgi:hypothetical protein